MSFADFAASRDEAESSDEDIGSANLGAAGTLAAEAIVRKDILYGRSSDGDWNVDRAKHERLVRKDDHTHSESVKEAEFEREQRAKDRDHKRAIELWGFRSALFIAIGSLLYGAFLIVFRSDEIAQQAGLAIISVILGGIAGGIGGYVAGGSGK